MNATDTPAAPSTTPAVNAIDARIDAACALACGRIAPAWPLDQAIAVNPHWQRIGMPVRQVAARMALLAGIQVFPTRAAQRQAWESGRITAQDLSEALGALPAVSAAGLTPEACVQALQHEPGLKRLPLLVDEVDNDPLRHKRLSWRQAITHQVSQTCAAYFDNHLADWQPSHAVDLYGFWRDTLLHDHGIGVLMGLPRLSRGLAALPATRQAAEQWVIQRLDLPVEVWADYLEAVLLTVNGWASWCAYLGWQAGLQGREDPQLRDLLAIRLAWGAILLECKDDQDTHVSFDTLRSEWQQAAQRIRDAEQVLLIDEVWQLALERGYQRELAQCLLRPTIPSPAMGSVEVQAAFCIDVRSEPLRRHLEAVHPAVQTVGFAGFFGMPIAYNALGTAARRPQLPGLLAPSMEVQEVVQSSTGSDLTEKARWGRLRNFARMDQWGGMPRWPGSAFSYVESFGIAYLGKMAGWLRPHADPRSHDDAHGIPARYRAVCRPMLHGLDLAARVNLAAGALHGMGLDHGLAPLVLLVGHGSQSANNAQAAALDCGACCGQTGEVNARVLARLLNDSAVRAGLADRGVVVPTDTHFVAAMHNTTTDEIEGFDIDLLPTAALERWAALQPYLTQAGDRLRRERAPKLDIDHRLSADSLLTLLRRRANDGAETRPEWGLAGNACFVIAPRERTRGVSLAGRGFLHDYDAAADRDGSLLELLMTAPMLVTHWINWQYNASTVDPVHLGSGNKVLHNVVGGHIGVFEGNGGDLRIGLSKQSLHDGQTWVHEPLRLTVVIDAPAQAIERVMSAHAVVRQLVDNGWLHLWRFDGDRLQGYSGGQWQDRA